MKNKLTHSEIQALIEHKITSNCDPEKASKEILELLTRLELLNKDGLKVAAQAVKGV